MITAASTVVDRLDRQTQEIIVAQVRAVAMASPFTRPRTPGGKPMRVLVTAAGELGWVGDGAYRYSPTDPHGRPWPPMPALWREIATRVAGDVAWDSAIVNWYALGSGLGWHVDRSEADLTLPIVTISLGDPAMWAVREAADAPVSRVRLDTGDVTLLAGAARVLEHSIERLIKQPAPSAQVGMFAEGPPPLLHRPGRISVTIRRAGPMR